MARSPSTISVLSKFRGRRMSRMTGSLVSLVKPLYSGPHDRVGYHIWGHVGRVLERLVPLVRRVQRFGIRLDVDALLHAAIGHDLLYHADAEKAGFSSKEQLSAQKMRDLLIGSGASRQHAQKVARIIMASHYMVEPKTPEEMLMRAADLGGLSGPFREFAKDTGRLYRESIVLSGKKEPFETFVRRSQHFLPLYVFRSIQLTPLAKNARGASVWHQKSLRNFITLFSGINGEETGPESSCNWAPCKTLS